MKQFTLKIGDHLKKADTKKYYNEQVFSEIAPRYDFITRALSLGRDVSWKRDLVSALPAHEAAVCADLACGTGDIVFLLAKKYPRGNITGIDITEPMLQIASIRNTYGNAKFSNQDMCELKFVEESIDIITGGYALRNAPDIDIVVAEIYRVLKPGGTAAFLDFSKPEKAYLQKLEYWILKLWTGFWGIVFHHNHEVYSYIAESLKMYPDRLQLRLKFEQKGFEIKKSCLYFLGITELLVVQKPINEKN